MAKPHRFTAQQVIAALRDCRGMTYLAAKRLQCNPQTIMNYCKRYPAVEQAKHDARGEMLDIAEVKLWQAVSAGQPWAITFCLRTVGRARGYGESLDLRLQIEAVASKVAAELGLQADDVLAEAQLLLKEMDHAALGPPIS
jgi:hypothetical protein